MFPWFVPGSVSVFVAPTSGGAVKLSTSPLHFVDVDAAATAQGLRNAEPLNVSYLPFAASCYETMVKSDENRVTSRSNKEQIPFHALMRSAYLTAGRLSPP